MPSFTKKPASTALVTVAFAIVYIVWGSTYFFIQSAVQGGIPPFLLGAFRFLIAGMIMIAWCAFKGEKIFVRKNIFHASVSGVLLLFGGIGSVIWIEQTLPSGMVAIMVSSQPIFFVLLDVPNWSANFRSKAIITGLVIGFAGVILLFSSQLGSIFNGSATNSRLWGMLLVLAGTISWSLGSLYSKYKLTTGSAPVNTAWQMLAAGCAFLLISIPNHEFYAFHLYAVPGSTWFALSYLILLGSIAGFTAYVWLLQVRSTTQVSTYAYVNPVIAVILGILFAKEHISILQVAGLFTILGSVLLISLAKFRKEQRVKKKEMEYFARVTD